MCKLHKNGCTWNLGACNLNRHNKSIIKNIRGHHTCLAPMLRQDNRKLDKHVIAQIIQPIVKTNPSVSIKMLIAEIKTFMNYIPSYKNHMPNCQNFWELRNLLFPRLWSLLKQDLCMTEEKLYRAKECLSVSFGHLVHALKALHIANP